MKMKEKYLVYIGWEKEIHLLQQYSQGIRYCGNSTHGFKNMKQVLNFIQKRK